MPPIAHACELDEDQAFDEQLPPGVELKAAVHFTPAVVARVAARLLAPVAGIRVLDVGSGAGKLCVVAAREVPDATFCGIELRPHLVRIARQLAAHWAIPNVTFSEGDALDHDWAAYDAFYLYNPFGEQHCTAAFTLDRTVDLDAKNFLRYVRAVKLRLGLARIGTRVVTYHGFGAPPPRGYELVSSTAIGTDRLALWIKTGAP